MSLVFFIDRSLGKNVVAAALRAAGATVEVHDDHFVQDALDQVWLSDVGRRGWVVLTKDERIRYRSAETTAAANAGVALFIFVGKGVRGEGIAEAFVKALPAMHSLLTRSSRPFVAKVSRTGTVTMVN